MTTIPCDPVLPEVERFLIATGMTATAFGDQALGDRQLVHRMRLGRELKIATRARVTEFMRRNREPLAA